MWHVGHFKSASGRCVLIVIKVTNDFGEGALLKEHTYIFFTRFGFGFSICVVIFLRYISQILILYNLSGTTCLVFYTLPCLSRLSFPINTT